MIQMDKKYRTRSGKPVRLLCTDAPEAWPVIAIVGEETDSTVERYDSSGCRSFGRMGLAYDLIEIQSPEDVVREALKQFIPFTPARIMAAEACEALRSAGYLRDPE